MWFAYVNRGRTGDTTLSVEVGGVTGFDWILFKSFGFLHCVVSFDWSDISQECTGHSHLQGDQNNHCSLHKDHFRHNEGYGRTFH
jgi:hypothetical protein